MTDAARPRLSLGTKLAYACGNAGNIIGLQLLATYTVSFYTPPGDKGVSRVPEFIFGLSVFTLLVLVPRLIDVPFDPWVANKSDRSTNRFGRRRIFMAIGVLPLALLTGLFFFPPTPGATIANVAWGTLIMSAYYLFYSTYVGPYLALLPELAPSKDESTRLSTMLAAAALLGGLIASVIAPAIFLSETDVDRQPMQRMAAALAVLSFIFMMIPVLFVNERALIPRDEGKPATHLGLIASLRATFSERAFIPYVFGVNLFFFAFTVLQNASPFYVEVLLRRPLSEQGAVLIPLFGAAALAFPVIAWVTPRIGKRRLMIGAALSFAVLMGVGIPLLQPSVGKDAAMTAAMGLFLLAGFPVALFLALPNSMIADICEANAKDSGERREAVFFGAQGLLQKAMLGAATLGTGWIAASFGKTSAEPLGVQLSGPLAAVALVASAFCFYKYPEKQVQDRMNK